jgi:hypothetical protein
MKIRIDGVTAGIGTGILYGGTGWLAHIIVRPDFRRRGSTGRLQTRLDRETADEDRSGAIPGGTARGTSLFKANLCDVIRYYFESSLRTAPE